jgi:hypothetical protein
VSTPNPPACFPALSLALRHAARLLLCAILHPRQVRRHRLGLRCFHCEPWRRHGGAVATPQDLPQEQMELGLDEGQTEEISCEQKGTKNAATDTND